jgi:sugar (pentulose or hexulose) kinase
LAAAVGRPVRVQSPRAAAIGAALVSTLAASDIGAAADQIASQAVDVTPSHTGARDATERYERWLHVRRALDQLAVGL